MSKFRLYFDLLKQTRCGFSLSKSAIWNCLKHFFVPRTERVSISGLAPVLLQIYVTRRCQLNCPFCVVGKLPHGTNYMDYELEIPMLERMLHHPLVKRVLAVQLAGGEPTLHKQLPEIVRVVNRHGKVSAIISNGLSLKDCYSDLLKSGLHDVQLSVYDVTFDRMTKLLPEINSIRPVHTSYVLTRSVLENNSDQVDRVVQLCYESGCSWLKINLCQPGCDETIYEEHSQYFELVQSIKNKYRKFKTFFPLPAKRQITRYKEKGCRFPWQTLTVNHNGDFIMCCAYASTPGEFGNIFDENNSLNSPPMRNLRSMLLSRDTNLAERCIGCPNLGGQFGANLFSFSREAKKISSPPPPPLPILSRTK
jgi:MoaA/NifB/PqqE/SkfB family radical SAM enzyme